MSRVQSSKPIRQEHIAAMGPILGPFYDELYNEVTWLHVKWLEYRKLYAHSRGRVDLLNEVAGFFFWTIQDVLWQDVLLHIARLTDPPRQGKHENLTLLALPDQVSDQNLAAELRKLIGDVKEKSEFARQWRNKHLAHRDLSLALNRQAEPLPGVSRKKVEDTLTTVRAVLNHLHERYMQSTVAYEHFLAHDDAEALVFYLEIGKRADVRSRERLLQGRPPPEDLELPPEA